MKNTDKLVSLGYLDEEKLRILDDQGRLHRAKKKRSVNDVLGTACREIPNVSGPAARGCAWLGPCALGTAVP